MVIYTNYRETVWNPSGVADFSKYQGDSVRIFLTGKGLEL